MSRNWSFGAVAKIRPYVSRIAATVAEAYQALQIASSIETRGKPFHERLRIEDARKDAQGRYDEAVSELQALDVELGEVDGSRLLFSFEVDFVPAWWVIAPGTAWDKWEWPAQWRYQDEDAVRKVDSHTVQHSMFPVAK